MNPIDLARLGQSALAQIAAKLPGPRKRPLKYRNDPTVINGERFDSKAEATEWCLLQVRERAGEIHDLKRQVPFYFEINGQPLLIKSEGYPNGRRAKFTVDFTYRDAKSGHLVALDVKGGKATATEGYKLRRALLELTRPEIEFREVVK